MSLRFEWVYFDAVGTLFRLRGSVGGLYAAVARRHGVEADAAAVEAGFHRALHAAPPLCFPGAAPGEVERLERAWWREIVTQSFAGMGPFTAFDNFFAELYELFRTAAAWELEAETAPALAGLRRAGARLAVVSDMDGRLPDVLAALGIAAAFETVVLTSHTGARKHDGELFRRALGATGARPEAVAHVGDNVTADIAGAQAAGITPIHFDPQARGGTPPGVATVHRLGDLVRVLRAGAGQSP